MADLVDASAGDLDYPTSRARSRMFERIDAALRASAATAPDKQLAVELRGPQAAAQTYWRTAALSLVAAVACTVWSPGAQAAAAKNGKHTAARAGVMAGAVAGSVTSAKAGHGASLGSIMGPAGQARQVQHHRAHTGGHRLGLPQVTVKTLNGAIATLNPLERVRLCSQVARQEGLDRVGLDWRHIYAVIHAESGWASQDGMGKNGKVSRGISQLEDATAQALGVEDAYDERQAATATARLLKESRAWAASRRIPAQSMTAALSVHYNLSSAARNAWDGTSITVLPPETQRHIANVADGLQYAQYLGRQYTRWLHSIGQTQNASLAIRLADQVAGDPVAHSALPEREARTLLETASGPGADDLAARQARSDQAAVAMLSELPATAQRISAHRGGHGQGAPGDVPDPLVLKQPALVAARESLQPEAELAQDTSNDDAWAETALMDGPVSIQSWSLMRSGPLVTLKRMGSALASLMASAVRERLQRETVPGVHLDTATAAVEDSPAADVDETDVPRHARMRA